MRRLVLAAAIIAAGIAAAFIPQAGGSTKVIGDTPVLYVLTTGCTTGATPECDHIVPVGVEEQVVGAFFDLVSDGTAGNRDVAVEEWPDGSHHLGIYSPTTAQPASKTWIYNYAENIGQWKSGVGNNLGASVPAVWLPAGAKVAIDSTGPTGAHDQLTNVNLYVLQQPAG